MSSSMWAPDNAQELNAARQTPRKTPFAAQHAKARDQGFWPPEAAASGSASTPGRRAKSGPGRSRGQGQGMDGFSADRGGRASGRGRPRGVPHFQQQYPNDQMLSPVQQTTSARGYGRKTSKDREAIWQSIWGDDSDEEKEKDKGAEEDKDGKGKGKEAESGAKADPSTTGNPDTRQLEKDLESVKITPAEPPVPPAAVIPPPPVISGADWSELTDDDDLAFLEDVPVPVASAPASVHEDDSPDEMDDGNARTPTHPRANPVSSGGGSFPPRGLDVTTANDIGHSIYQGSPKVNVGRDHKSDTLTREKQDGKAVDVKLAEALPVPTVNPEQAQTTSDIGSEGESAYTTVGRGGTGRNVDSNANATGASHLQGSRWAGAGPGARGMGPRGARGNARMNAPNDSHRMPPFNRNQQQQNFPQNFPRPPANFNRPPPTGPRAQTQAPHNQPPRGSGSRNAPPLHVPSAEGVRPSTSGSTSASESDRSSPFPHSTTSETSAEDSPTSSHFSADTGNDPNQRGPRQAAVPRDTVKRLMRGWIGTGPGGMRRGTSGRGRARAPVRGGEAGPAPPKEENTKQT